MAITPQAIKDQEFQQKFRGYDTIEVKAYLELIAEEFFEQLEEVRGQNDTIEALEEEKEELLAEKRQLEEKITDIEKDAEEKIAATSEKDVKITELEKECERLRGELAKQEGEKALKNNEVTAEQEKVKEKDTEIKALISEKAGLEMQIDVLSKQIEALDAVEVDFKSTLIMAQRFSNDIKEKSEAEAQEILDLAIEESEKLRKATMEELARYPKEIEILKEKRNKVRDELAAILTTCLDDLDIFQETSLDEEDAGELFKSIELPDDGTKENPLDDMSVDFSTPDSVAEEGNAFSLEPSAKNEESDPESLVS